jgi:dUTPase
MAQIVFAACVQARLEVVDILSQTERNAGGFGSTGV